MVWNGGEGLTTYGAQRPGAVLMDVKEGDVVQWMELQQYDATHPRRVPGIDTDSFAYVVLDDRAYVPQSAYRWAIARLTAQWSRVLAYARYAGWPSCQLCERDMPTYTGAFGKGARERRHFTTPRHRCVCETCYVRYRMARGRWKGMDGFAKWHATRTVFTPAERVDRRRAREKAAYARKKAAGPVVLTPDQLDRRRAADRARHHQQQARHQTPAATAR